MPRIVRIYFGVVLLISGLMFLLSGPDRMMEFVGGVYGILVKPFIELYSWSILYVFSALGYGFGILQVVGGLVYMFGFDRWNIFHHVTNVLLVVYVVLFVAFAIRNTRDMELIYAVGDTPNWLAFIGQFIMYNFTYMTFVVLLLGFRRR